MVFGFRNLLRGLLLLRSGVVLDDIRRRKEQREQLDSVRSACPDARISESVILLGYRPDLFRAAAGAVIREGTILAFGDQYNGWGRIDIGFGSWIGQYNNLRASGGDICIGRRCLVSQYCSLIGSNHAHALGMPIQEQGIDAARRGVRLGDDVWLGVGCAVMPGVEIGEGAIIGANAVVTCNVPANEIWAGVPARKIGERV